MLPLIKGRLSGKGKERSTHMLPLIKGRLSGKGKERSTQACGKFITSRKRLRKKVLGIIQRTSV